MSHKDKARQAESDCIAASMRLSASVQILSAYRADTSLPLA